MKYRADIDGLRSVAVLPVVIFHIGSGPIAPGGFIGVDIFFVISGFLITKIIYDNIEERKYSVVDFYVRRAKRILPALVPIYLFCIISSIFLLFPSEQIDVRNAVLSSAAFVSNIFFYSVSGYFDQASKSSPLLHTWSLSVEEQFYVFLPVLIYLLSGKSRSIRNGVFAAIAVASFAAACLFLPTSSDMVFYLLPFRAWELLLGSMLAIGAVPAISNKFSAQLASIFGLALIGASIQFINSDFLFPGWAAAPACIGAALVIHAGSTHQDTIVGKALGCLLLRFIGKISYSLYLWHWPLIVFYPYVFGELNSVAKLSLLVASIAAATLSWRFIETPFRKPVQKNGRASAKVLIASGFSLAAVGAVAIAAPDISSTIRPINPEALALLQQRTPPDAYWRIGQCFLTSASKDFDSYDKESCLARRADSMNILLIGDSHAAQYYPGLKASFPDAQILQATASGCHPVGDFMGEPRCTKMMDYVINSYLPANRPIDMVIMAARWKAEDAKLIHETIERLSKHTKKIVIVGPIIEYSQPLPRILAYEWPRSSEVELKRYRLPNTPYVDAAMKNAVEKSGVKYISALEVLCDPDCHPWSSAGNSMQFDYGHLSKSGSEWFVAHAKEKFIG